MPEQPKAFAREATGLTREVSTKSVLVGNLVAMGVATAFFYTFFASQLYTGVYLPLTVAVGIVPAIVIGLVYYLFSVAMPRTGGDYVWVSRILNPSSGFLTNFLITSILWESVATATGLSISFGLVPMLGALGILWSNSSLISLASQFSTPPSNFIIIIVIATLSFIPALLGTRFLFKALWVVFGIATLGTIATIGAFLSAPPATFIANFNQLAGGMTYANVISTAALPKGFSLQETAYGSVFTILAFFGYNWSSYYGGEVKKASRSQFVGMIGGILIFAIVLALVFSSAYYSMGQDFINAISTLAGTGNPAYTLPAPPALDFLVVFAAPNAIVVVLSGLAVLAVSVSSVVLFSFLLVRNFFAWSFDRLLPEWFTRLDSRHNSPYLALVVALVGGLFFCVLYVYTIFFQFIIYQVVLFNIAYFITCFAAIVFPYRRKALFEASPEVVKKKFAGIPLISVLGVIGTILSAVIAVAAVLPGVTPPPSGPILVQAASYLFVPLSIVAAYVVYAIAIAYRKRKGMNLDSVFSEIPPE